MEERLAPQVSGYVLSENAPKQPPGHEAVVRLDDYRLHKKLETLRELAMAAWRLCDENTLSCKLIDFYEEGDSDYTLKFALYDRGFPDGESKVSNHRGWSGGPESKRIVVSSYCHESDTINVAQLHPRNFRYIESDLRSKIRQDETYGIQMKELDGALKSGHNAHD